jgi:hypothetical protein
LALLYELASTIRESDEIECQSHVAIGDAFEGIVRMAEETSVDLLVLEHRRQVLRDVFIGTTAERVLRTSRIPCYWPMAFQPVLTARCSALQICPIMPTQQPTQLSNLAYWLPSISLRSTQWIPSKAVQSPGQQ